MRVKVLLQITVEDGAASEAAEVAVFERQTERPEDLGLSIAEGKALTAAIQQHVVDAQVATSAERHRCCEACGARRHSMDSHPVIFMKLYADVKISSPRPSVPVPRDWRSGDEVAAAISCNYMAGSEHARRCVAARVRSLISKTNGYQARD
jgi:hypothetical protein